MTTELSYLDANKIIGGLSNTSKMPGWSWSLNALECQTGSQLAKIPGSVCNKCYALRGAYRYGNVQEAMQRRMEAIRHPQFEDAFVKVLEAVYGATRKKYLRDGVEVKENRFRFFDSGDIQSLDMLKAINRIALRCPDLDMWLPTKEARYVHQFLAEGGVFAPNLNVRLSHPMVGQTFKKKPQGCNFSTVGVADAPSNCPAYTQGNKCSDCRMCWNKAIEAINYPLH